MRYTMEQVRRVQPKKEGFIDNPVADLVYRRLSRYVTWLLAPTGITPVAIVWLGFLVGGAGVGLLATGDYVLALAGMLVIHAGNVLDCVDGELARLTGRETKYGGWLDLTFDAVLEFLILAGLVWGLRRRVSMDVDLGLDLGLGLGLGLELDLDLVLVVGLLSILATSMMYFSIAWSACVFEGAVDEHVRMKRSATRGPLALLRRIHPMILSYSGDMRKGILTVFLLFDEPFWFLAFNAAVGNLYWMARIWIYRKR